MLNNVGDRGQPF